MDCSHMLLLSLFHIIQVGYKVDMFGLKFINMLSTLKKQSLYHKKHCGWNSIATANFTKGNPLDWKMWFGELMAFDKEWKRCGGKPANIIHSQLPVNAMQST